jgi:putative hydrolase of the HAD superfamily
MSSASSGSAGRAAHVDLVTVDAFGTLLELVDPTDRLRAALVAHGVPRGPEAVAAAFAAEVDYYVPRSHEGRDTESLARLRRDSAAVFLGALEAAVEPEAFAPAFVGALEFRLVPGAERALRTLCSAGITLACTANWDVALQAHLQRVGVAHLFTAIVSSAEAGAPKPAPAVFLLALERAGVEPDRALHIGDDAVDREGAVAASLAFEPAPLVTLPIRLGVA